MGHHPLLQEPLQTHLPHNFTIQLEAAFSPPAPDQNCPLLSFLPPAKEGGRPKQLLATQIISPQIKLPASRAQGATGPVPTGLQSCVEALCEPGYLRIPVPSSLPPSGGVPLGTEVNPQVWTLFPLLQSRSPKPFGMRLIRVSDRGVPASFNTAREGQGCDTAHAASLRGPTSQ